MRLMGTIQVEFDEDLLARFDAEKEVKEKGRSAVLMIAVAEYLEGKQQEHIGRGYRQAYGKGDGLGDEFAGWEEQGEFVWYSKSLNS